ncbi:hypothetical protein [Methylobacterium brachiatum]|uniref:hypothetical protein n=1 Tax=Methylobacterium brachiatum TaxID=269660 RepID=UPI0013CF1068|nr:hypothetical protein [Methylobacterium brachiatum]
MNPPTSTTLSPVSAALRARFADTNDLRFTCDLDDAKILWWERALGSRGVWPDLLCRYLSHGVPFRKTYEVTLIDPAKGHARIEIWGYDEAGRRVLKAGRSVEFDTGQVHLNKLEIVLEHQGKLHGRFLLRNAYVLAKALGFGRLALSAMDNGSYVWARAGFYPWEDTWNDPGDGQLRDTLLRYIEQLPPDEVDWRLKADIYDVVNDDDPKTIWALSALPGQVSSRLKPGEKVRLGWAMLVESGATWQGHLPFATDPEAEARLRSYLAKLTNAARP